MRSDPENDRAWSSRPAPDLDEDDDEESELEDDDEESELERMQLSQNALGLRMLTATLGELRLAEPAHGLPGGENDYGAVYENDVFRLHSFCF